MDELIFFGFIALAAVVLGIVLPIIALTKIGNLRWELEKVKKELTGIQSAIHGDEVATNSVKPQPKQAAAAMKTPAAKVVSKPTPTAAPVKIKPAEPAGPTFFARMAENIKANWIVWLAGVSLAFGGVFIVQFGIERGLLGPTARVAMALAFGVAMIIGAEFFRRRSKNQTVALFSPVTALAAGGIASLFGAVVSAHTLYGLTSALIGFISMAAVAWVSMALAMIYGPVLAVIGILGAYFSPLLVNSDSGSPMMYAYFLLVLAASLFVERWNRWIWLSALSISCALLWGALLHLDMTELAFSAPYYGVVFILAMTIPAFGILPKFADSAWVTQNSVTKVSSQYPTILTVCTGLAVTALTFMFAREGLLHWQIATLTLLGLTAIAILLCRKAQNLDQLAAIFGFGLIATLGLVVWALFNYRFGDGGAVRSVVAYFPYASMSVLGLAALGVGGSLWRAGHSVRSWYWHILTVLLPLISFIAFYIGWAHSAVRGPLFWKGAAVALAIYFTVLAILMIKRREKPAADILGTGAVAAWVIAAYIGMNNMDPWLTVAIAGIAALAYLAVARHQFRWVAMAGVLVTGLAVSRLVLEPGWLWAANAMLIPFLIAFVGTIAIFALCLKDATIRKLSMQVVQFETAGLAALATFLCVWLVRWSANIQDYTIAGIYAALLAVLAIVQYYRRDQLDDFKKLRNVFGKILLVASTGMLVISLTVLSPLILGKATGYFPLDSIVLAYGLPAIVLFATVYFKQLPMVISKTKTLALVASLISFVAMLEIRRFFHGTVMNVDHGVFQGEMYAYTFALLFVTVAVFVTSVKKNSLMLRRIGLALAAATAFKVFLFDISELRGLGRATSFIGLGLTLAGLGWLHQTYAIKDEEDIR